MIQLTHDPIDTSLVVDAVADNRCGATVLFVGTTREFTEQRQTESLDYECYPEMARKKMQELHDEACRRWPIVHCEMVHRLGRLELGEASVAVAVSSPHRVDAFHAAMWILDQLKQRVPIWKQENWADGTSDWVHPTKE